MSEVIHHRARAGGKSESRRDTYPAPEQKLMLAVLSDAVNCLSKKNTVAAMTSDRSYQQAKEWILAKGKGHLFCFESICEALDWDPERVRRRVLRQTQDPSSIKRKHGLHR